MSKTSAWAIATEPTFAGLTAAEMNADPRYVDYLEVELATSRKLIDKLRLEVAKLGRWLAATAPAPGTAAGPALAGPRDEWGIFSRRSADRSAAEAVEAGFLTPEEAESAIEKRYQDEELTAHVVESIDDSF